MRTIANPVLKGFYPDPSILRVGREYYIATSTFEWFPGVTLLHSRDLQHWETLQSPLGEESGFDLRGIDTACGIWAPNLTYSDGVFYLLYTIVYTDRHRYKDTHNFLITANTIEGPWSKPVFLNCSGFDPSLFHDDDGRKWMVNMTVDQRPSKKRFSGIVLQEYDAKLKKLVGNVYPVFSGTERGTTEGPNLYKHGGYYYLLCAEGGTEFGHCCTLARSREITGKYEVCPENPVLTSDESKECPFQRAGHGSLVETAEHNWLMAHLCSRPVERFSILGRETAIENVEWTADGWLRLSGLGKLPKTAFLCGASEDKLSPPAKVRENFDAPVIPKEFLTLRQSPASCGITAEERKGFLRIYGGNSLSSKFHVGLLAHRLQSLSCTCTTAVEFYPQTFQQTAGLVCFYNGDNYDYLNISGDETAGRCISVVSMNNRELQESERVPLPETAAISLRARIQGRSLYFSYALQDGVFKDVGEEYDMAVLSDEHVEGNGFTGAMVGMACEDLQAKNCCADFGWFQYEEETEF